MRTAWVPLSRACNNACPFCAVADHLDRRPLSAQEAKAALDAALARGAERIVFTGGEPTLSGQLINALAFAHGLGKRTALSTNGRILADEDKIRRLKAVGLDEVAIALHGVDAATHNALTGGDPLAFAQTSAALRLCAASFSTTLRTVLCSTNLHHIPALLRLAADLHVAFDLRALTREGEAARRWPSLAIDGPTCTRALDAAARLAADLNVPFSFMGFDGRGQSGLPLPPAGRPLDEIDLRLLRQGVRTAPLLGGTLTPGAAVLDRLLSGRPLSDQALEWAALRMPLLDRPANEGGLGPVASGSPSPTAWRGSGRGRVAVVGAVEDHPLWTASALPALHHHLRAAGVTAELYSPLRATFDADHLPQPGRGLLAGLGGLLRGRRGLPDPYAAEPSDARRAAEELRAELATVPPPDLLITAGWHALRLVPASWRTVRKHVVDTGLLDGFDPDLLGSDDVIRSPWPSMAAAYRLAGIPQHQLHWRPHPVVPGHLPPSAAARGTLILGAGARADLPGPIWTTSPGSTTSSAHAQLPARYDEALKVVAGVRLVWVPSIAPGTVPDARWISLALALGRPVLGPDLLSLSDHVRDGHEGLLVPSGDEPALAEAVHTLTHDHATWTRLSQGARRRSHDVQAWAGELIDGAPERRIVGLQPDAGPWYSW